MTECRQCFNEILLNGWMSSNLICCWTFATTLTCCRCKAKLIFLENLNPVTPTPNLNGTILAKVPSLSSHPAFGPWVTLNLVPYYINQSATHSCPWCDMSCNPSFKCSSPPPGFAPTTSQAQADQSLWNELILFFGLGSPCILLSEESF